MLGDTDRRGSELDKAFSGPRNASGQRHGRGTYRFPNQFYRYEGDFVHGEAHGRGRLSMADGGYYEGDFERDEITGSGERCWSDGKKYVGAFEMGEMHGRGTLVFPDGATYAGGFQRNARSGRGALALASRPFSFCVPACKARGVHAGARAQFRFLKHTHLAGTHTNTREAFPVMVCATRLSTLERPRR